MTKLQISKGNIVNIVLSVLLIVLVIYVFQPSDLSYIKEYELKIENLEKKVDSLHSDNLLLEQQADSLEFKITEYDIKIKKLNSRIYVIKKQTQKQLDAVDMFGDDELERFFAERYRQYQDSIN